MVSGGDASFLHQWAHAVWDDDRLQEDVRDLVVRLNTAIGRFYVS